MAHRPVVSFKNGEYQLTVFNRKYLFFFNQATHKWTKKTNQENTQTGKPPSNSGHRQNRATAIWLGLIRSVGSIARHEVQEVGDVSFLQTERKWATTNGKKLAADKNKWQHTVRVGRNYRAPKELTSEWVFFISYKSTTLNNAQSVKYVYISKQADMLTDKKQTI